MILDFISDRGFVTTSSLKASEIAARQASYEMRKLLAYKLIHVFQDENFPIPFVTNPIYAKVPLTQK